MNLRGPEAVLLMSVSDLNTNSSFFLENQTLLMILPFLPAVPQFFLELSLKFISEVSLAASHPLPPQSELLSNYYLYRFIWQLIIYGFITCLIKRFICTCINYSLSSKQIRNSLRAGSGPFPPLYSTHGTVQKLQKYLFIYLFSQQRFVELTWCPAPSTETACLVLSEPAFLLSKTPSPQRTSA